jgi:hypothetical protein
LDQINLAVRIKFVTLIVGLPIIAFAVYAYPKLVANAAPSEIVAVGAAGVALLTLIYSALNHHQANQIYSEQLRIQKIRSSMEIIDHFHVAEMTTYIRIGSELRKEVYGKNRREIAILLNAEPEKKEALIAILNYIESFGIVIRMNGAHEDMLGMHFMSGWF